MKTCKKCNIEQPLENFTKANECKICEAIRKKNWYLANKKRLSNINKIRYENNKDYYLSKNKLYYENNLEKKKESDKKYYEKNKIKIIKKNSEYVKNNFEKTKQYKKQWSKDNKEKIQNYRKDWFNENKERVNQNKKDRLINDPLFALTCQLRKNILKTFRNRAYEKTSSTKDILGCSFEEFKEYLESKFEPWMNWENRGLYNGQLNYGWDIDHIIPLSSAKTEEEIIRLNHYTNLQPLCSYTNRHIKKDNPI